MRLRFVLGVVVFFILAAVALAGIMSGQSLFTPRTSIGNSLSGNGNPIVLENAHLGTESWKIPAGKAAELYGSNGAKANRDMGADFQPGD